MTKPILKYYTESPDVLLVQEALNKITSASDPSIAYVPSTKALSKMGRDHYRKLQDAKFALDPDGKYGRLTKARVVVFQERVGVPNIDGIVGPDETWPALASVLTEIKKATFEKVLRLRPNLTNAKQLSAEGGLMSHDCGYFAGYAVAEAATSAAGATSISFDRKDALAGRDAFLPSIPTDEQGTERSKGALHQFDAAAYLESLGASGYSHRVISDTSYSDPAKMVAYLDTRMNGGRTPVMVSLSTFINASIGHWIGILASTKLYGLNLYLIYDSSGKLPKTIVDEKGIAGITTVWADEYLLNGWFKTGSASNIISKF